MSDTVFFTQAKPQTLSAKAIAMRVVALAASARALFREWRHNYRSRRELALYPFNERCDLNFASEVEAEIAKPFWKK
jgi:uncharacterized protein YjiS (DUF1127 family)